MSKPQATIIVQQTPLAAAQRAVDKTLAIIEESTQRWSECFIALSGGTTPRELYRLLAQPPAGDRVPWERIQIFFSDERDVAPDHVESNYRLASSLLLDHVPIPLSHVHPMPADCRDMAAAAEQYENLIRRLAPPGENDLPQLDLVLLGIGGEGHVASLFPDTPALEERQRLVVSQYVPVIGRNRMTFTFPLINAARHVMFLATGADKANAVAGALSDDEAVRARYPASRVRPTKGELIFMLDAEAARGIAPLVQT